jgi:hypothetical protein
MDTMWIFPFYFRLIFKRKKARGPNPLEEEKEEEEITFI